MELDAPMEGAGLDPPDNPFIVEVVLRTLFDYMDLESLGKSRLVCRLWNRMASQNFHKKMMALNKTMELTHENWSDFAGTFDTRQGMFFWNKLTLKSVPLKQMFPRNLFRNYGDMITHFSLLHHTAENMSLENFREVFASLKNLNVLCLGCLPPDISACKESLFPARSHTLPSLRKIQVHLTSRIYSCNFFKGLFTSTPVLERLTIRDTRNDYDLVALVLDVLSFQMKNIRSLKVAQLNESNLHVLNSYAMAGMKLDKLSLESLSSEVTHATVFELLSWQAPHLKSLVVGRPSACRSVFINFTFPFVMPQLRMLDFWTHSVEWGGIHYAKQLPQLKKIVVRAYKSFHNWPIPLPDPRNIHPENRCSTVNTIVYVDDQFSNDNQVNIWKLYLLFPRISRVCVDINDVRTFVVFWTFWTSLEELEIRLDRRCSLPDSSFTGFKRDALRGLTMGTSEQIEGAVHELAAEKRQSEGIGKLPRLRKLTIFVKASGQNNCEPYHEISDVTGYYLVLKLPELQELSINSSSITSTCMKALSKMPNMKKLDVRSNVM